MRRAAALAAVALVALASVACGQVAARDASAEDARAEVARLQEDLREVRRERNELAADLRALEASALAAAEAVPDLSCVYTLNGGCLSLDQVLARMMAFEVQAAELEDALRQAEASAAVSYTGIAFVDEIIGMMDACAEALGRGEGRLEACGPLAIRLGTLGLF